MLHHIVLMEPANAQGLEQIKEAMPFLATACDQLAGATGFAHGPNLDFEGKSARFTYGFSVSFSDRAAHLAYEAHPDHIRAGAMLVAACAGGHAGIFVADLAI
jgi:hypothetical protein